MTRKAPWDARYEHTSVIDAAGNIYVLGGYNNDNIYSDVWMSADKGETLHAAARLYRGDACHVHACVGM